MWTSVTVARSLAGSHRSRISKYPAGIGLSGTASFAYSLNYASTHPSAFLLHNNAQDVQHRATWAARMPTRLRREELQARGEEGRERKVKMKIRTAVVLAPSEDRVKVYVRVGDPREPEWRRGHVELLRAVPLSCKRINLRTIKQAEITNQ